MSSYVVGVIFGVIVTIAFIALLTMLILKAGNKDGRLRTEYDERQKIIIGEGYKIAFWTLAALLVALQIAVELAGAAGELGFIQASFGPIVFALIIISIMVFCVYSVWNGAYWGLNNNKKKYIIILAAIGVLNLAIGIGAVVRRGLIVDGALSGAFVNLMCGLLMVVVLGVAWIRDMIDKDNIDEGEE